MKTLSILCLALTLATVGCKKGNDELKKKVTAIRDKALACKDAKCATAASEEYVSLTKDLSGLSDEDSKFFAEMGTEIRTIQVKLEGAH